MASPPPPSPRPDRDDVVADMHGGLAHASPSSLAIEPPAGPVPFSLAVSREKRASAQDRCASVAGCSSPAKKKQSRRRATAPPSPPPADRPRPLTPSIDDAPALTPTAAVAALRVTPSPDNFAAAIEATARSVAAATSSTETPPTTESTEQKRRNKSKSSSNTKKPVYLDQRFLTDLRPTTFDSSLFNGDGIVYEDKEMDDWTRIYQRRVVTNFEEKYATKKKLLDNGRQLRSAMEDVSLVDIDAGEVETTDRSRLSRYVLEDILQCSEGARFVVLVKKESNELTGFDGKPSEIAAAQKAAGIAGDIVRVSTSSYFCLKGRISHCPMHAEFGGDKGMTHSQLETAFSNGGGGFTLAFASPNSSNPNAEITIPVQWQWLVKRSHEIMFFGRPFAKSRPFDMLFRHKANKQFLHHILRQFASEYDGDVTASSQLLASYHKHRAAAFEEMYLRTKAKLEGVFDKVRWKTETDRVKGADGKITSVSQPGLRFCKVFNFACRRAFVQSMSSFQDYSQPLLPEFQWRIWMRLAKETFPDQWRILASLRNLRDGEASSDYKERQVFCQILALIRVANPHLLCHWAMINTTAYYGWGVRAIVNNTSTFWGNTVSRSYRDKCFTELSREIVRQHMALLSEQEAVLVVWDNHTQDAIKLRDQRGGKSSQFLVGTHEASHQVHICYDDTDAVRIWNSYNEDQIHVAPPGMRKYESIDPSSPRLGTSLFINHCSIEQDDFEDLSGKRMAAYDTFKTTARILGDMGKVFHASAEVFDQCPDYLDRKSLDAFSGMCKTNAAKELFAKASDFQKQCVRDWNPHAGKVTQSLLMGFVGIDESAAKEAGAAFLDLALKAGFLIENPDGTWSKSSANKSRRLYSFGDAKSNENVTAFVNSLHNRPMSLEELSAQANVFAETVDQTAFYPGDWHTGLNMLSAIYKTFYDTLLNPIQDFLDWKRINDDPRETYYQSSRLVVLANREYSRHLWHSFISARFDEYKGYMDNLDMLGLSESDVLTQVSVDFQTFLEECKRSDDEHIRMIALFVIMSNDFIEFVESYRIQDSLAVELGYMRFAPVFKMRGQNKYLAVCFAQLDTMYKFFGAQHRTEARWNRFVRSYPAESGKAALAMDEWLEICNRDLSLFPVVRTLKGMCRQGNFVGVAKRCKRTVELYYGPGNMSAGRKVYKSGTGSKGNQTQEKRLVHETAHLFLGNLTVHLSKGQVPHRQVDVHTLRSLEPKTKLDASKLKSQATSTPNDSASRMLNGVNHVFETIVTTRVESAENEKGEIDEEGKAEQERVEQSILRDMGNQIEEVMDSIVVREEGLDDDEPPEEEEEPDAEPTVEAESLQATRPADAHTPMYLRDLWREGWEKISEMNPRKVRADAASRVRRKKAMAEYIILKVQEMKEASAQQTVCEEKEDALEAPWTSYLHSTRSEYYY